MEYLTEFYRDLNLDPPKYNLQFVTKDPHHLHTPKFKVEQGHLFWYCQSIVRTALALFSYLFGLVTITNVLYTYKRSTSDPAHAEKFLLKYDVQPKDIIKDEHYYFALNWIIERFRPKWKIHPVHFTDLRWYPWNTSTSAERPFTTTPGYGKVLSDRLKAGKILNGRRTFGNLYTEVFELGRRIIHRVKNGYDKYPDNIQMHVKPALVKVDEPEKVRSVWGIPKYFIFAEAMFFWPLFSHYFSEMKTPLLWNYETLNGGWYRLNHEVSMLKKASVAFVNTDWSEFDMRVYFSVWQDLIDGVKTYFCFCGRYCPAGTYINPRTNPQRLHNLWNWFTRGYFKLLAVSPLGNVFARLFAGMPSGIFTTQFWDSLYNGLMLITCLHAMGFDIKDDYFIKLLGDDALFEILCLVPVSELPSFLEALSTEAFHRFGSKLSAEKTKYSTSILGAFVLGYRNWNGWPKRDAEDLLARLLHPKSLRDTPERLMARCVGIAYASPGDMRVFKVCKHIYDELDSLGFTPSMSGLHSLFDPMGIQLTELEILTFPTQTQIFSRVSGPSGRSAENQRRYWNPDHFHYEAGIAAHWP